MQKSREAKAMKSKGKDKEIEKEHPAQKHIADREKTAKIPNVEGAWLSLTTVLVVDTEHMLVVTGGTQPYCSHSDLYRKCTRAIEHLRIGDTEYATVIQNCSSDFATRAAKVRALLTPGPQKGDFSSLEASEIEEKYAQVVTSESPDLYDKVPSTKDGKMIFCWACEGDDFSPKRPCIRCQSFYSTWKLHGAQKDSVAGKGESLEDICKPHLVPYDGFVDKKWNYCAETVAATKLFLLRHGTLALV